MLQSGQLGEAGVGHLGAVETELFKAGLPVFQLLDSDGEVFFMRSYSLQVDPWQTMDALKTLGQRLRLPRGWSFRVVKLRSDYLLEPAGGQATVIQDDLLNTYEKSAAKAGDEL